MVLVTCSECGKEKSSKANMCPHCGYHDETQPSRGDAVATGAYHKYLSEHPVVRRLISFVVSVAALVACYFAYQYNQRGKATRQARAVQLTASVNWNVLATTIANTTSFEWTDCSAAINAGIIDQGWRTRLPDIGAGESVVAPFAWYVKSNGERFNYLTHQVNSFTIECETPDGHAVWNSTNAGQGGATPTNVAGAPSKDDGEESRSLVCSTKEGANPERVIQFPDTFSVSLSVFLNPALSAADRVNSRIYSAGADGEISSLIDAEYVDDLFIKGTLTATGREAHPFFEDGLVRYYLRSEWMCS